MDTTKALAAYHDAERAIFAERGTQPQWGFAMALAFLSVALTVAEAALDLINSRRAAVGGDGLANKV